MRSSRLSRHLCYVYRPSRRVRHRVLAVIAAAALFWWVLLPLLLIAIDLMIVLVPLVVALVGRVLFRRPWTVEATAGNGERVMAEVVGWRAARVSFPRFSGRLACDGQAAAADGGWCRS